MKNPYLGLGSAFLDLLESAPDAMLIVDVNGLLVSVNSQAEKLFEYPKEELFGKELETLIPERFRIKHVGHRNGYFQNPIVRPMGAALTLYGLKKTGIEFPVEISLSPLRVDGETYVISAIRDATERRITEDRIRTSLKEKEILLKEVHHRVKNNLQIISSIINLQADRVSDSATRELLNDTRARIRSIALVHERLYESRDLVHIRIGEYLQGLVRDIIESFGERAGHIVVELKIEDLELELDQVVNCGLIVTELVSNALKYAFLDMSRPGKLCIELERQPGSFYLHLSDNGPGMPDSWNLADTKTLGLFLVRGLVSEMEGELRIRSENGAHFEISIPLGGGDGQG